MDLKSVAIESCQEDSSKEFFSQWALCATDSVLILDEPVTGLDPAASMEFYETIKDLNKKENVTIIMVSHDIKNALNYATHILHLEQENDFFGTVEEYKKSNVSNMFLGGVAND